MNNFKNKRYLITGASSGLGRELSIELDKRDADLTITGRNEDELKKTFDYLKGINHLSFPYDLNDIENLDLLFNSIFNENLSYDGFIHCAGIHTFLPLNLIKLNELQLAFNVNVISPHLIIKEISKKKNFNENASLLLITSVMGMQGSSSLSVYSSSKAAQIGMVKSLAVELSKKNIRINSIAASMLESKILDKVKGKTSKDSFDEIEKKHLLGLGNYEDIIPSIVHLLSTDSKWITGTNMVVDGGYTSC